MAEPAVNAWRSHAATRPRLDAAGFDLTAPEVVIVGAGPVGLTIAAGLGRAGVRTVVLEADSTISTSSRANAISYSTFEVIDRVAPGLAQQLIADSMPMLGGETFLGHRLLSKHVNPTAAELDARYPPTSYLSQWNIEWRLGEYLASHAETVELRWQNEVTGVTQERSGVSVAISTPDGDYQLRAPWLVAADGGRSTVRRLLGHRMSGEQHEVTFIIVDARIGGVAPPPIRRAWFDPPYLHDGLLLRHMTPEGVWRLDFQLPADSDLDAALEPEWLLRTIRAHLVDIGHETLDVELANVGKYTTRTLVLDDMRDRRVLFAGDAAHLVPIFGGFGLNSGVEDAANLHWKLGLVASGQASEALLDTYSAERVPALRQMLSFVARATEFMTPTSAASEQLRRAALSLAAEGDTLTAGLARHRPFRHFPYASSAITADDDDFTAGPGPGARLPHGWVADADARTQLVELLGDALTVLAILPEPRAGWLEELAGAAATEHDLVRLLALAPAAESLAPLPHGCHGVRDTDARLTPLLDARVGTVYLVRTDGVVAGRWHDPSASELRAAIARAVGDEGDAADTPAETAAEAHR